MKLIFYVTSLHSGYLIFKTHSESIQDHRDVEVEREIRELVASLGCTDDVSCWANNLQMRYRIIHWLGRERLRPRGGIPRVLYISRKTGWEGGLKVFPTEYFNIMSVMYETISQNIICIAMCNFCFNGWLNNIVLTK